MSEATNAASDEFGDERLHACFADGAGHSAAETVDRLLQAVRTFVAGAPQSDDITILAISRTDAAQADPAPGVQGGDDSPAQGLPTRE